jgi:hypothetical protein
MTIAPRYLIGTAAGLIIGALLLFRGPWAASAQTDKPTASNTSLSCEQSQQAMVRHTIVRGELQVAMQCVGPATVSGAAAYDDDVIIPAVYRPAARPVYAERVVSAPAPVRRTTTSTRAAQGLEPKRSWKKTALVIGGSAGAGAGVGAIAGGKKGALIGAAIGGGAASIFEAIKRR